MKLSIIDENNFILFIIDKKVIPLLDENEIGEYLKKIFLNIKSKYSIDIYGYYDVVIYKDDNYGMIIKLKRDELEYVSYYDKQIEMKIMISENQVFYKINDIYDIDSRVLAKSEIYLYKDELYLILTDKISFILLGTLIENSKIVFEETDKIVKNGEKIRW